MAGIANSKSTRLVAFLYDVAMAAIAVLIAVVFRFGSFDRLDLRSLLLGAVIPFTAAAAVSLLIMRTYRTSWRHASTADLIAIVQAVTLATVLYVPLSFVTTL